MGGKDNSLPPFYCHRHFSGRKSEFEFLLNSGTKKRIINIEDATDLSRTGNAINNDYALDAVQKTGIAKIITMVVE